MTYSLRTGELRVLASGRRGISAACWSPLGTEIAVLAFGPAAEGAEPADPRGRGGVIDPATGWTRKVWTVDANTAEWTQLTASQFDDGGACADLIWTPEADALVFASDRTVGWRHHYETSALYRLDVRTRELIRLTPDTGRAVRPSYSRDGKYLAYIGSDSADRIPLTNPSLWVMDESGERTRIHDGADAPAGFTHSGALERPVWIDESTIACIVSKHGTTHLVAFGRDGSFRPLTSGGRVVEGVSIDATGKRATFISADPTHPSTVRLLDHDGERIVFDPNDWAHEIDFAQPLRATLTRDQLVIDYWLMTPKNSRARHPLILDLHGLTGGFADDFYFDHQTWVAQGYAVVYCNPRGSYGGTEQLLNGSLQDFGGADAEDALAVLDDVLKHNQDLDPERVGVTGYSYGGYLTNRLLSLTGRFRAAASGGAPTNFISWIGSSDLSEWFLGLYLPAPLSRNLDWYIDRSPALCADHISTPLLIYNGEADTRVPVAQAEELYRELRRHRCEVELVIIPGEAHMMAPRIGVGTGTPSHQLAVRRAVLEWLDAHLSPIRTDVAAALQAVGLVAFEDGIESIATTLVATRRGLDTLRAQATDYTQPFDPNRFESLWPDGA